MKSIKATINKFLSTAIVGLLLPLFLQLTFLSERVSLAGFMTHCYNELPVMFLGYLSKNIRKCHVLLGMDGYPSENIRLWKLCIRSDPIRTSDLNIPDHSWHEYHVGQPTLG
jgi:hypothetical protein